MSEAEDIRKLMENINSVLPNNPKYSGKFAVLKEMDSYNNRVVEDEGQFEENFDYAFNKYEDLWKQLLAAKAELGKVLQHAASSDPENMSIDFKRQEVEETDQYMAEKLAKVRI